METRDTFSKSLKWLGLPWPAWDPHKWVDIRQLTTYSPGRCKLLDHYDDDVSSPQRDLTSPLLAERVPEPLGDVTPPESLYSPGSPKTPPGLREWAALPVVKSKPRYARRYNCNGDGILSKYPCSDSDCCTHSDEEDGDTDEDLPDTGVTDAVVDSNCRNKSYCN